jgi:ParB family chromosome partitioning protein
MNIQTLSIDDLFVSEINVRKLLSSEYDETDISDLADNIKEFGLINPLTVRKSENLKYEIIAGAKMLFGIKSAQCNVLLIDDQKAEELSLKYTTHTNDGN